MEAVTDAVVESFGKVFEREMVARVEQKP